MKPLPATGVLGEGVVLELISVLRERTDDGGREGIAGAGAVEDTLALFVFRHSFLILFIETRLLCFLGVASSSPTESTEKRDEGAK